MATHHRVLIIEDTPSTIDLLEQIVSRAGYTSVLARRGAEGLRILREEGADLVLLDLMMRDMDGWTFLETIRADERFAELPVFIISARHPREDPHRMESHGAMFQAYFVKPFEVEELLAGLAEMLPQDNAQGV
jgi:two-component system copper resistance phosphate regulon response regulator CusR